MSSALGFNMTGKFCIHHMGPSSRAVFNWADSHEGNCDASNLMQLSALFPALATTYAPTARAILDGTPLNNRTPGYTPGSIAAKTCSSWYSGDKGFSCVVSLSAYTAAGDLHSLTHLLPLDYLYKRRAVVRGDEGNTMKRARVILSE